MYEPSFVRRLVKLGPRAFIKSYDTVAGLIAFFVVYIFTDGGIAATEAADILTSFATVSATLFAIVLTGFTIIASFTDQMYLYAWKQVGEFENIVTTFQYNLLLPVIVLLITLTLQIQYHSLVMLVLIALFVYMLFSLIDLLGLISRYALQRGEFIRQQIESANENPEVEPSNPLDEDELKRVLEQLHKLEEQQLEQEKEQ